MSTWGAIRLSLGVIAALLGTLCLIASVPSALIASGVEASVGRSGVVTQSLGTLRAAPSDEAVIVDGVSARLVTPQPPEWLAEMLASAGTDAPTLADDVGDAFLVATSGSGDVFLGVADVEAVNAYLDGTPYSVAVRDGQEWPVISVPGTGQPAPPAGQAIWAAAQEGNSPEIPADALESLTLVLMNSDVAPGPESALRLEYRVPQATLALQSAAITAAATALGGLALVLLGGWLVVGRRRTVG
jgi:hypothetical protein